MNLIQVVVDGGYMLLPMDGVRKIIEVTPRVAQRHLLGVVAIEVIGEPQLLPVLLHGIDDHRIADALFADLVDEFIHVSDTDAIEELGDILARLRGKNLDRPLGGHLGLDFFGLIGVQLAR